MICAECQTENPPGARFCTNCGASQSKRCSQCAADLPTHARFCPSCGARVVAAPPPPSPPPTQDIHRYIPKELLRKLEGVRGAALAGERRVVTVLFADVKGSTAAAEQLDPEDWADVVNGAFERMVAPVFRYEGTLARLMGDAILAFFGAPIGHEDDPERAIRTGLAIVQEIGPYREQVRRKYGVDIDVRVGINTGLVVVGEVGSDLRLEYTALGDAVNVAARMEQTAEPGTVRIADPTYRLAAPLFETDCLGGVLVKGKTEPVLTWRVRGPKLRPGSLRGIEGLRSPLVGRDRELGALKGQIEAVGRGAGQIVSVQGEPGLGKSRLMAELQASADGLRRLEGRSLSYETGIPYAPWARILRAWAGIDGSEDEATQKARVRRAIEVLDPQRVDVLGPPLMGTVLQLPLEAAELERVRHLMPPELREQAFEAVLEVIERLALDQPLVVVLEDLHWVDSASLNLAIRAQSLTARAMLGLVAVFRPRTDDPVWTFHEHAARDHTERYLAIRLEPLPEPETRELLGNLLHVEGLPEPLRVLILQKAEGNPLFVEEVIRSLIDSGAIVREGEHWRATRQVEHVAMPDTLQGVLTARLDALDETTRGVAQVAAVIGREFELPVLAALFPSGEADPALADLERRGLVRLKSSLPASAGARPQRLYAFKHALVQEAAYGSVLNRRRRELHATLAGALEQLHPERPSDIARHFLEGHEPERALPWLVRAGQRAMRGYAMTEALALFARAVEIVEASGADPETAHAAFDGLGNSRQLTMDLPGALGTWQQMETYGARTDSAAIRVSALNKTAMIQALFLGNEQPATECLLQSEQLAKSAGVPGGIVEASMVRCAIHVGRGELDVAKGYLEGAEEVGKQLGAEEPRLFAMAHIANTLVYLADFDAAWPRIQETLAFAREKGNKHWEAEVLCFAAPMCLLRRGEVEEALALAVKAEELAREAGVAFPERWRV